MGGAMNAVVCTQKPRQQGFTLLEVLVALGIAATSLIALYTLANQLLSSASALDERQAALWCADNHLVSVSLMPSPPLVGEVRLDCKQIGRDFVIKRVINTTPNPLFNRIELSVYPFATSNPDSTGRVAFLTTLIPSKTNPR
jgi:general secretion pathway protein I